jgi:flagellar protein FliS
MEENQYFDGKYTEEEIRAATPLRLIIMLYDAALRSCEEARVCMERNDASELSQAIDKCNAIISELQSALNLKEGGDIASALNNLYNFMKTNLLRAGVERNPEMIGEVFKLLVNLRAAWRDVDSELASTK